MFHDSFMNWTATLQFSARKEKRLVPCRMKRTQVIRQLYRYGQWNQADWSVFSELGAKMPRPVNDKVELRQLLEVKKEFLRSVMEVGHMYSVSYRDGQEMGGAGVAGQPAVVGF